MIYLDTHVVVWLYEGDLSRFPPTALRLLEENDLAISPVVRLELQHLREIERITVGASDVLASLSTTVGLRVCDLPFDQVIVEAMGLDWTRDPFDRIIVATVLARGSRLLTKDRILAEHCQSVVWS